MLGFSWPRLLDIKWNYFQWIIGTSLVNSTVIYCGLRCSAFARCLLFCLVVEEVVLLPGRGVHKELLKQNNKKKNVTARNGAEKKGKMNLYSCVTDSVVLSFDSVGHTIGSGTTLPSSLSPSSWQGFYLIGHGSHVGRQDTESVFCGNRPSS